MYVKLRPVAENINKKKLFLASVAGWSSSVARWAHNPEVVGSNPAPATKLEPPVRESELGVWCFGGCSRILRIVETGLRVKRGCGRFVRHFQPHATAAMR